MKRKLDKIRKARESKYGTFPNNMDALGKMWTAILEHHYRIKFTHQIPVHILALMHAQTKICRAANPSPHHQDNYDDCLNYVRLAMEFSAKKPKTIPSLEAISSPEKPPRGSQPPMKLS